MSLPLEIDDDYVAGVRERVRALPQRRLRLPLLSNSQKKFHEKAFLLFFNAAGTGVRDCVQFDHDNRSWTKEFRDAALGRQLPNINFLSLGAALAKAKQGAKYDHVVSFDSNQVLPKVSDPVGAPAVHIGTPRWNVDDTKELPRPTLGLWRPGPPSGEPIRVFNLMGGNPSSADFRRALGNRLVQVQDSIKFPPNVDVHFRTPATPAFPYVVVGGNNRDFRLLYRCRDVFDGKVLVLQATPRGSSRQNRALEKIRRDPRFVCVCDLDAATYLRVLLYSRVVVLPFRVGLDRNCTVVGDALWCGRPVVTTRVRPKAPIADRLSFFRSRAGLKRWVDLLADEKQYRTECARVRNVAVREHDLQRLLASAYTYMADGVSAAGRD